MSQLEIADLNFFETASCDRQQLQGGGIVPDNLIQTGLATGLATGLNTGLDARGDIVKGFSINVDNIRGVAASAAAALALNGKAKAKANAINLFQS
jgi:hypothetical protein